MALSLRRRRARPPSPVDATRLVDVGTATATGRRSENQDRVLAAPGWAVLSDGVGGHAGGATAAQLTVEAVRAALAAGTGPLADDAAVALVARANHAVREGRLREPGWADMAATVVVAVATAATPTGSRWTVVHLGDSPAWLVTAAGTVPITADHSLAGDLLRSGAITAAEAATHPGRRFVTRAVGVDAAVAPEQVSVDLGPGDALVLASDGLSDVLDAPAIHGIVTSGASATVAAQALVTAALGAGTHDNVTVAVLRHLAACR